MFFPLVVMVPEGKHPVIRDFIIVPGFLNGHVTSDSFSFNSDAGAGGKESVRRFRQFSGANFTVRAEKAVAIAAIQAPRIGAGDLSFSEAVGLNVHFVAGELVVYCSRYTLH